MAVSSTESASAWLIDSGPIDVRIGHVFDNITVSGNARAIFGDVQISCPEISTQMSLVQSRRTFLNVLFYENMQKRYAQIETARAATCDWVWQTGLGNWLSAPLCNEIFWISGKPGSGKSTLMKYLARSPETRTRLPVLKNCTKPWIVSNFFFDFRASEQLSNTDEGLLRSLLHQLVMELPIETSVLQKYEFSLGYSVEVADVDQLINVVAEIIDKERMKLLFLVDGLDEYENNTRDLIRLLQRLQSETGLRLCVASRPEPIIQAMLAKSPTVEVQEYNLAGIEAFIRHSVSEIRHSLAARHSMWVEHIVKHILQKADGVFLWAQFANSVLLEHIVLGQSETEVYAALNALPRELDGMYERIFNDVPQGCRSEASMILLLVEDAGQFVTLGRLRAMWQHLHALLGTGPTNYQALTFKQFELRLRGLFGGLLDLQTIPKTSVSMTNTDFCEADATHVRLVHETLRAYMRKYAQLEQHLDARLKFDYFKNTWLKTYIEIIHKALQLLTPEYILETLYEVMDTYKLQRLKTSEPWRPSRAHVVQKFGQIRQKAIIDELDRDSGHQLWPALPYAILQVYDLYRAEHKDIMSSKHHTMFKNILESPILLLYELMQATNGQVGFAIRSRPKSWSYDLAIIASRGWLPYPKPEFETRIQKVSEAERNSLIICVLARSATFAPSLSLSFTVDDLSTTDREYLLKILIRHRYLRNFHLAFFAQALSQTYSAMLLPAVKERWLTQGGVPDTIINNNETWFWQTLYPRHAQRSDFTSLVQTMPVDRFQNWLALLKDLGFDLFAWRNDLGNDLLFELYARPEEREIIPDNLYALDKIVLLLDEYPDFRERAFARNLLSDTYYKLWNRLVVALTPQANTFVNFVTLQDLRKQHIMSTKLGSESQSTPIIIRLYLEIIKRLRSVWSHRSLSMSEPQLSSKIWLVNLRSYLMQWLNALLDLGKGLDTGDTCDNGYDVELVQGQVIFLDLVMGQGDDLQVPKRKRVTTYIEAQTMR